MEIRKAIQAKYGGKLQEIWRKTTGKYGGKLRGNMGENYLEIRRYTKIAPKLKQV